MIRALAGRLRGRTVLVVGKGGMGKTTVAGGLALALADDGEPTHLLSTDPAHSLADLFETAAATEARASPCADDLVLEELDAESLARDRIRAMEPGLRELIDRGTYLDEEDAESLLQAAVPGLDELGSALRIGQLHGDRRLVVDTAPTGHTLRLLDLPDTLDGWIDAFRAMAAKADAVVSALVGRNVSLPGEADLDRFRDDLDRFRRAARAADFVIVTGAGAVVQAEAERLQAALDARGLRTAARVSVGPAPGADLTVPRLRTGPRGCAALRALREADDRADPRSTTPPRSAPAGATAGQDSAEGDEGPAPAPSVLELLDRPLVLFAGKGGVGKSTCAAAAAVALAASGRRVSLISADPAGSLHDILGPEPPYGVDVVEMDAGTELERLKSIYRDQIEDVLEAMGVGESARMDQQVVESLWGLAPPGIDEVVALARLARLEDEPGTTTILDTAPTGHFLRLLAMPALALDWVHRLMRVLLKYRAVASLDAPAEPLIRLARQLRFLRERLADPSTTSIILVTLDEPMVASETHRLAGRLTDAGLAPAAIVSNRLEDTAVRPERNGGALVLRAPGVTEPVGAAALRRFIAAWEPVS